MTQAILCIIEYSFAYYSPGPLGTVRCSTERVDPRAFVLLSGRWAAHVVVGSRAGIAGKVDGWLMGIGALRGLLVCQPPAHGRLWLSA